jgi:predicted permease
MSALGRLWRALFRRGRFERELDDELAFHRDQRTRDLVRGGVEPGEAARRARVELGMVETHKAHYRAAVGLAPFDGLLGDLQHAVRTLRRNPGFASTATLILAVAIAANVALFAFFETYVLQGPDVRAADRLVDVHAGYRDGQVGGVWSVEDARRFTLAGERAFEGLFLALGVRLPLWGATPTMTYGLAVSDNYFSLLGARMQRGRAFDASELREPVVVLSASGWRRLAGADPDVVGSALKLGAETYTVIGVASDEFRGIDVVAPQYWIPRETVAAAAEAAGSTTIGGILRAAVTPQQAHAALQPALDAQRASEDAPGPAYVLVTPRTSRFDSVEAGVLRKAAIPVFILFLLVLLVACANLANLMLARAAARQRELAIRLSVGASRWRVMRHLLVESALIATLAATLGTLLCAAAVEGLQRYAFGHLGPLGPDLVPAPFETWRMLYTLALALVATLAIGLAPALAVSGQTPASGARDKPASIRQGRLRHGLLVAQLAASVVLLILSSLIVANARRADGFEPGFDAAHVVDLAFPRPTERLIRDLASVAQVRSIATVARAPLYGQPYRMPIRVGEQDFGIAYNRVDAHYFETLGVPLLRGRTFIASETHAARVAIVSAATAQRLWPGQDPIGRAFEIPLDLAEIAPGRYEVVGVAADVASGLFLEGQDRTMVYFPVAAGSVETGALLARVAGDPGEIRAQLVDACTRADPAVLCEPMTLADVVASQRVPLTISAAIASSLGFAALLISCIGLYGVVAFAVAQRTREIGVRIACGATPSGVVRFVLSGAVRQIGVGMAIGLPICVSASVAIAANVELVSVFDLRSYLGMPLLLALVALAAAFVPARRAAGVAPNQALREDG